MRAKMNTKVLSLLKRDLSYVWRYPVYLVRQLEFMRNMFYVAKSISDGELRMVVVPPAHAGDVFLALDLIAANQVEQHTVVVLYERYEGLVKYFPTVTKYVTLDNTCREARLLEEDFVISWRFGLGLPLLTRRRFEEAEVVLTGAYLTKIVEFIRTSEREGNFINFIAHTLGLQAKTTQPFVDAESWQKAHDLAQSLRVESGRTVLLVPYSQSDWKSGQHFLGQRLKSFEILARMLWKKGYKVLTNVGPREDAIPGTIPARIPLELVIPFASVCGNIIAVRNGVTDMIASSFTGDKLVVIYEDYRLPRTTTKYREFFSLSKMFGRHDIWEVEFSGKEGDILRIADLF